MELIKIIIEKLEEIEGIEYARTKEDLLRGLLTIFTAKTGIYCQGSDLATIYGGGRQRPGEDLDLEELAHAVNACRKVDKGLSIDQIIKTALGEDLDDGSSNGSEGGSSDGSEGESSAIMPEDDKKKKKKNPYRDM